MLDIHRSLIGPPHRPDLPRDVEVQLENARYQRSELEREQSLQRAQERAEKWARIKSAIGKILGR